MDVYAQSSPADSSFPIQNRAGNFTAGFSRRADGGLLRFSYRNASLTLSPLSPAPVAGSVYKNSITYPGIYSGTDLKYTLERNRLKEELILEQYTGMTDFSFRLGVSNTTYSMNPDSFIIFRDPATGKTLFYMPRPFAVDDNGKYHDLDIEFTEDGLLKISIDPDWLRSAAYPVVIDPTIYLFDAVFSRPSAAYTLGGVQVPDNNPRYEPARFDQGILIEQETTNLLTANQSSIETDLAGLSAWAPNGGLSFVRAAGVAWSGAASARAVNNFPFPQACAIKTNPGLRPAAAGQSYTASAYVKKR